MGVSSPKRIKKMNLLTNKLKGFSFTIGDVFSFGLKGTLITLAVKDFAPKKVAVRITP
jgi:hypothetical protein